MLRSLWTHYIPEVYHVGRLGVRSGSPIFHLWGIGFQTVSDKYRLIFIAEHWDLVSSDKYRLIFIAEHWDPECSDKYRLIFIAEHLFPTSSDKCRMIFIAGHLFSTSSGNYQANAW